MADGVLPEDPKIENLAKIQLTHHTDPKFNGEGIMAKVRKLPHIASALELMDQERGFKKLKQDEEKKNPFLGNGLAALHATAAAKPE